MLFALLAMQMVYKTDVDVEDVFPRQLPPPDPDDPPYSPEPEPEPQDSPRLVGGVLHMPLRRIEAHTCPRCGRQAGDPCNPATLGKRTAHLDRVKLAARSWWDQLPEEERPNHAA